MDKDLTDALYASGAMTSLFGDRMTWRVRAKGSTGLALVMTKVGGKPLYTHDGRAKLAPYDLQFDVYGGDEVEAVDGTNALKAFLDTLTGGPFSGAFIRTERDGFDLGAGPQPSGKKDFHRTSLDVRAWHTST